MLTLPQRKSFDQLEKGSKVFCIVAGTANIAERTVKSVEGYNHAGNPNYVKITVFQNIQKTAEISESKIIELAKDADLEKNIDTFVFAVKRGATMVHLPLVMPEPWATTKEELEKWMNKG